MVTIVLKVSNLGYWKTLINDGFYPIKHLRETVLAHREFNESSQPPNYQIFFPHP